MPSKLCVPLPLVSRAGFGIRFIGSSLPFHLLRRGVVVLGRCGVAGWEDGVG